MRYQHILSEVLALPWAVEPGMLARVAAILAERSAGIRLSDAEIEARIEAAVQQRAAARDTDAPRVGTVAVVSVVGTLMPRGEALQTSGAMSVQRLTADFNRLVADESVRAILLDWDSPGGSVGGIAEFADAVHEAQGKKPVVSIANPTMASAAYWVAANSTEVWATPSAVVGSIGVYSMHEDISRALEQLGVKVTLMSAGERKVLGNPFEPLSEEARAELQSKVDGFYGLFTRSVARGRGVSVSEVREGYGQGSVLLAADALKAGMVDRIGTLAEAVMRAKRLAEGPARGRTAAEPTQPAPVAEEPTPEPQAVDPEPVASPSGPDPEAERLRRRWRVLAR